MVHLHQVGVEGPHYAGFQVARVDAKAFLRGGEQPGRHPHGEPVRGDDQHAVPDAQVARDDVHRRDLAAMRVQHHQFPHACPGHAVADVGPHRHQGRGGQGQRAGIGGMFVGFAHRQRRQDQRGQVGRDQGQRRGQDPVQDRLVRPQGQVRPVLFHRAHRQDGDHPVARQGGEVARGMVGPEAVLHRHPRIAQRVTLQAAKSNALAAAAVQVRAVAAFPGAPRNSRRNRRGSSGQSPITGTFRKRLPS